MRRYWGLEFDYLGVIVGPELVYGPMDGGWVGQPDQSHDPVVRRGVTSTEFTRDVKAPTARDDLLAIFSVAARSLR